MEESSRFDADPAIAFRGDVAVSDGRAAVSTVDGSGLSAIDFYEFDGVQWVFDSQVSSSLHIIGPVALDGDYAVAGIPYDSTISFQQGAAVLFSRSGGSWAEVAVLRDPNGKNWDRFGSAVAMDGGVLAVGSPQGNGALVDSGTAVTFRFDGAAWNYEATLSPSNLAAFDQFGGSLDLDDGVMVVGAVHFGSDLGAAWVYRFDGVGWIGEQQLGSASLLDFDLFGDGVSVDGDVIAVGASNFDDPISGYETGGVFIFRHDGASWNEEADFLASSPRSAGTFGAELDLFEGVLVVGEPARAGGTRTGSAYIFQDLGGGLWHEWSTLVASDSQNNDWFGAAVALDDGWAWIGAPGDGNAVYTYPITAIVPGVSACNGAGVNPSSYSSSLNPILGTTWSGTIDATGHPGAGLTFIVGYDMASSGLITPYGELLVGVEVLGGNLIFSSVVASGGGSAVHSLAIPSDPGLQGFLVYSQGVILGGAGPELCNALDLVAGI
ncbi:MAG: hypothetical protein ACI82F_001950 [Planctomycetota bacterium]|jgi:hypothetical protein